jgi:hypothetical protein
MNVGFAPRSERWRAAIAMLMTLVISVMSFSIVMHRSALASPAYGTALARLADSRTSPAKPCHATVLPGAANTCPMSSFCFGAILGADAGCALPSPAAVAVWRLADSSLVMQCPSRGLFRPPRSSV